MISKVLTKIIKALQNILLVVASFIACFAVIEIAYRYQLFDFYSSEFNYLNKDLIQKKNPKKVLVFGDSFTASANNYVNILNESLNDITFINAAIPGIGAQEISCIAKNRLEEIKPALVIIQVYVGNDLIDIEKPINWNTISVSRNVYWFVSNSFYSMRYFNYKLGQMKQEFGLALETSFLKNSDSFALEKMSKREKMLVLADPNYYEKSIQINPAYENRFATFLDNINQVTHLCYQNKIPVKVMVIPASCQVSDYYKRNLEACGATFTKDNLFETNYPFIAQLKYGIQTKGVQIINPLPYLQQIDSTGNRLYFENDLHLNDKGNVALAKYMMLDL